MTNDEQLMDTLPVRGWCAGCTPDNCMGCATGPAAGSTAPDAYCITTPDGDCISEDPRCMHRRYIPRLKVKRVHPDAKLPTYGTAGAACFDVRAVEIGTHTAMLMRGGARTFRTGLAFEVPPGFVMLVFSRSGHGFNNDVRLANCVGVIDSDYRGELRVRLTADNANLGMGVREGDRIAQCMLQRVEQWAFQEVSELSETARGEGAYGSTGR